MIKKRLFEESKGEADVPADPVVPVHKESQKENKLAVQDWKEDFKVSSIHEGKLHSHGKAVGDPSQPDASQDPWPDIHSLGRGDC